MEFGLYYKTQNDRIFIGYFRELENTRDINFGEEDLPWDDTFVFEQKPNNPNKPPKQLHQQTFQPTLNVESNTVYWSTQCKHNSEVSSPTANPYNQCRKPL